MHWSLRVQANINQFLPKVTPFSFQIPVIITETPISDARQLFNSPMQLVALSYSSTSTTQFWLLLVHIYQINPSRQSPLKWIFTRYFARVIRTISHIGLQKLGRESGKIKANRCIEKSRNRKKLKSKRTQPKSMRVFFLLSTFIAKKHESVFCETTVQERGRHGSNLKGKVIFQYEELIC